MRMSRAEWKELRDSAPDGVCEIYTYSCEEVRAFSAIVSALSCPCIDKAPKDEAELQADSDCGSCGGEIVRGVCLDCE